VVVYDLPEVVALHEQWIQDTPRALSWMQDCLTTNASYDSFLHQEFSLFFLREDNEDYKLGFTECKFDDELLERFRDVCYDTLVSAQTTLPEIKPEDLVTKVTTKATFDVTGVASTKAEAFRRMSSWSLLEGVPMYKRILVRLAPENTRDAWKSTLSTQFSVAHYEMLAQHILNQLPESSLRNSSSTMNRIQLMLKECKFFLEIDVNKWGITFPMKLAYITLTVLHEIYPEAGFDKYRVWLMTRRVQIGDDWFNPPRGFGLGNLHYLSTIVHIVLSRMLNFFSIECEDDSTKGIIREDETPLEDIMSKCLKVYTGLGFDVKIEKTCISQILHFCEMYRSKEKILESRFFKAQKVCIPMIMATWSLSCAEAKMKFSSWWDEHYSLFKKKVIKEYVKQFLIPRNGYEFDKSLELISPPEFGGWYDAYKTSSYNSLFRVLEEEPAALNFAFRCTAMISHLKERSNILFDKIILDSKVFPKREFEPIEKLDPLKQVIFDKFGPGSLKMLYFNALNSKLSKMTSQGTSVPYWKKTTAFRKSFFRKTMEHPLQSFTLNNGFARIWSMLQSDGDISTTTYAYPTFVVPTKRINRLDNLVKPRTVFIERYKIDVSREASWLTSKKIDDVYVSVKTSLNDNIVLDYMNYFQAVNSMYPLIEPTITVGPHDTIRWLNPNSLSGLSELETYLAQKGLEPSSNELRVNAINLNRFPFTDTFPENWGKAYIYRVDVNTYICVDADKHRGYINSTPAEVREKLTSVEAPYEPIFSDDEYNPASPMMSPSQHSSDVSDVIEQRELDHDDLLSASSEVSE
jgi:hypothetical protein